MTTSQYNTDGNGHANAAFINDDIQHVETTESTISSAKSSAEWGGGLQFLMACIATSIGLGNVWRFPYAAYENGGGAFLIPYIIVLLIVGKPIYFLETLLGQFTNRSCGESWRMAPAMKGLGVSHVIVAAYTAPYYSSMMSLTLYYLVASFQSTLPWTYCREEWKTNCISIHSDEYASANNSRKLSSSTELYFRREVLKEIDSIENGIGLPSWQLIVCLAVSWATIFLVLMRGLRAAGKSIYFLAVFPYIIMIILLVRAVTLPGAVDGVLFFITPQWNKIFDPHVWYAAMTQCFFSLSVCFGGVLTYSSYNNFRHPLYRDVMIVTTLDTFTSFMIGCTVFGMLGNLALQIGTKDISSVVRGGSGLAFISYPDAISRFDVAPQVFSVLFFLMLYVLCTGSIMSFCASIHVFIYDYLPADKKIPSWWVVLAISSAEFLISLLFITPGGQWFVALIDYYGSTLAALITGFLELVTIFWIYGLQNFLNDVEFMLGFRPGIYWRLNWAIITPLFMILVLLYTFATYAPLRYDKQLFPDYAYWIGWMAFVIPIVQIGFWIFYKILQNYKVSPIEMIKCAFMPSEKWGPKNAQLRSEWRNFIEERKVRYKGGLIEVLFK